MVGLIALAAPSPAQVPVDRSSWWEASATIGALRFDDDFSSGRRAAWRPVGGASIAWRPSPRVRLGVEGWRHLDAAADAGPSEDPTRPDDDPAGPDDGPAGPNDGESLRDPAVAVWGAAAHFLVLPWAGRMAVDPVLIFGIETIHADDDEDRGPAFVSGAGAWFAVSDRGSVRIEVRNHFMTIEEAEIDGVETGRDASLWEIRAGVGWRFGGGR